MDYGLTTESTSSFKLRHGIISQNHRGELPNLDVDSLTVLPAINLAFLKIETSTEQAEAHFPC